MMESTDPLNVPTEVPTETGTVNKVTSEQQPTTNPSAIAQNQPQSTAANVTAVKMKKKSPVVVEVDCVRCNRKTGKVYRGMEGWLCEACAPPHRQCKNTDKGCTYWDIENKCVKHEVFFCPFTTRCDICKQTIPDMTLDAHYAQAHADITCRAGAKFTDPH